MAQRPPGRDQDHVDPDILAFARIFRRQIARSRRDPGQPPLVDGEIQLRSRAPPLHFYERDEIPPRRHQIHFADGCPHAPREDPPALEAQPPRRRCLPDPAALFRATPIPHPSPRSTSARA
jgi:hypothetical protein